MQYCVYLVTYKGNKLPPFYIGSTSTKKIENGYMGSVSSKKYSYAYRKELKNNPNLFKIQVVLLCKTRKEALQKEYLFHKSLSVVTSPLYINQSMAIENGFFGMDNSGANNGFFGKSHTTETLKKMCKPKSTTEKYKKPKSKSHSNNISKAQKGVPWTENDWKSKTATCEHCGLTTIKSNITRWHSDKCKHRLN